MHMFSLILEHLRRAKRLLRAPVSGLAKLAKNSPQKNFPWLHQDCNDALATICGLLAEQPVQVWCSRLFLEECGHVPVNLLELMSGLFCDIHCGVSCVTQMAPSMQVLPVHNGEFILSLDH